MRQRGLGEHPTMSLNWHLHYRLDYLKLWTVVNHCHKRLKPNFVLCQFSCLHTGRLWSCCWFTIFLCYCLITIVRQSTEIRIVSEQRAKHESWPERCSQDFVHCMAAHLQFTQSKTVRNCSLLCTCCITAD